MADSSINTRVDSGGTAQGIVGAQSVTVENLNYYNYYPAAPPPIAAPAVGGREAILCPYPGLAYFGPDDSQFFFGRDDTIERLSQVLDRQRLVALVGASGTGKSSVILAGLAPFLCKKGNWRFTYFRIGTELDGDPFRALARSLLPFFSDIKDDVERLASTNKLARQLETNELALRDIFAECRKRTKGARVLLIADQFEEVFTRIRVPEVQNRFIDCLLMDFTGPHEDTISTNLILTLRADFYENALNYRPLADALQGRVENLGPMNRQELKAAIELPAKHHTVSFTPGLVDTLLSEVEGRTGGLPLMQFALREMWSRQAGKMIGRELYDAVGGITSALANRAESIFRLLTRETHDEETTKAFRRLFTRLILPGQNQAETRRVVERTELGDGLWRLAQRLASEDNRLVVTNRTTSGIETVEIVHEALIGNWPRLVSWMEDDREFLAWLRGLRLHLDAWRQTPNDDGTLLRGGLLAQALNWRSCRPDDLSADETAFIAAGEHHQMEIAEQERKVRERERSLVLGAEITLSAALLEAAQRERAASRYVHATALLGAALHANPQVRAAAEVKERCSERESRQARSVALQTRSQLYGASLRLIFGFERAIRRSRFHATRLIFHPGKDILTVLDGKKPEDYDLEKSEMRTWPFHWDGEILDYLPSLELVLVLTKNEILCVSRRTGKTLIDVPMIGDMDARLPRGRFLKEGNAAVVLSGETCYFVDFKGRHVTSIERRMESDEPTRSFDELEVSRSGHIFVAGSDYVYRVDLDQGSYSKYPTNHGLVLAIALDELQQCLYFGGLSCTVCALHLKDGTIEEIGYHADAVSSITIIKPGELILTAGWDGKVSIWNLADAKSEFVVLARGTMLRNSTSSADGRLIAFLDDHGSVVIWKSLQPRQIVGFSHRNTIMGAVFSPLHPDRVIAVSFVGEFCAAIWTKEGSNWVGLDLRIRHPLRSVAAAPAGHVFAICGDTPEIFVYSANGELLRTFSSEGKVNNVTQGRGHRHKDQDRFGFVPSVSVSHDGRRVAWVAPTGRIWIGDVQTGETHLWSSDLAEHFTTVCYSPVEEALVAVTREGTAIWLAEIRERKRFLDNASDEHTMGKGVPMAFSYDGCLLAIAKAGSRIAVISVRDQFSELELEGHQETFKRGWRESVGALAFDPLGRFLVSGGSRQSGGDDPRTVRLWDPRSGEQLLRVLINGDCHTASVNSTGETIGVASGDRFLLLPVFHWLTSQDTATVKAEMEQYLGMKAEELFYGSVEAEGELDFVDRGTGLCPNEG